MKTTLVLTALLFTQQATADLIGEVSTKFRLALPDDKIVIEAFDDPHIAGATCYLSRAKKGGLKSKKKIPRMRQ